MIEGGERDPAAQRFAIMQAARLAGALMVLAGVLVISGQVGLLAGLPPIAGYVLIAAGLLDFFAVPVVLARIWRSK